MSGREICRRDRRQYAGTVCTLVLAALCFAGTAQAARYSDDQTKAAVEAHNAEAADKEKLVCKRIRVTGSHFKRRVCQTTEQWKTQQLQAQEEARRIRSSGVGGGASEGS